MMRKRFPYALLFLLLAFGAACSNDSNPTTPITPEEPEPVPTVTETFMGALALGESSCHDFDVTQAGSVTMSITAMAPLETLTLGMGIGVPDENAANGCGFLAADITVRKDESFLASLLTVGAHCVCVFDVGNIFAGQTVTYTLDVEHP